AGLAAEAGLSSHTPTPGSVDSLKPPASAAWTSSADAFASEADGEAAGGGALEDERVARTPATIAIAAPTTAVASQIHLDAPDRRPTGGGAALRSLFRRACFPIGMRVAAESEGAPQTTRRSEPRQG